MIENSDNKFDNIVGLIDGYQEKNSEIFENRNKIKNELNNLNNAKRVVMLSIILSCLIKFPKVYNYDFLLNFIAVILESISLIVIDSKRFILENELESTYIIQDLGAEITLDAPKQFLEDEKRKVLVKGK